ncbi:hypothetical protein B0H17DRAFT_1143314 [Mycena rosella]|uniref:Uncharacterized protein n=1 Tax=Mycena rosella TaxID=1033263 RepID=A0AAD7CV69_MYCRO|nr:hypothetical protein B0H17DRAFT_1143314 [Mycena rosella]
MYSLVVAFEDEIFEDIQTPEDFFFPRHPCTQVHKLRIKQSACTQLVFCKEVFDSKKWVTSETLAMPAHFVSVFYRKLSLFWFHCLDHVLLFSSLLSHQHGRNVDRRGTHHDNGSKAWHGSKAYQSRLLAIDLGAILAEWHEIDEEKRLMMKSISGMSKDRDPNTPISLNAFEMNELYSDEGLVELRENKAKLLRRLTVEITELKCLNPEDPVTAAQEAIIRAEEVIRATRAETRDIEREHAAVVSRETYTLIAATRLEYFNTAS